MRLTDRGGLEVTPIVVNGVMYLPAADESWRLTRHRQRNLAL